MRVVTRSTVGSDSLPGGRRVVAGSLRTSSAAASISFTGAGPNRATSSSSPVQKRPGS